eukprot:gene680-2112_t
MLHRSQFEIVFQLELEFELSLQFALELELALHCAVQFSVSSATPPRRSAPLSCQKWSQSLSKRPGLSLSPSNNIPLPVLCNLNDVHGGLTHLSPATRLLITAEFATVPDSDISGADESLLIVGVSRQSPEANFTPMGCEISAHPQYQSHDSGCTTSVELAPASFNDPAWLLCAVENGFRWRPSQRKSQSHSMSQQPPTFLDSEALSQIDCALISGDIPVYHSAETVMPGQSSHLRIAERKLSAPLSRLPHTTSVAKGVHQNVQPLLVVGLPPRSPDMNFTPISGKIESVPKVQQYDSASDPSQELSAIHLERACKHLCTIRAQASSQQYRGSTTWYDYMIRSKQMPRTADRGLRHFSGADHHGSPSPSSAAGSARRGQEHSWYGTILRSKAAAAAHGRG